MAQVTLGLSLGSQRDPKDQITRSQLANIDGRVLAVVTHPKSERDRVSPSDGLGWPAVDHSQVPRLSQTIMTRGKREAT